MLQPSALEEGDMEFCRSDKSVTLIPGGYEPSLKSRWESFNIVKPKKYRYKKYE